MNNEKCIAFVNSSGMIIFTVPDGGYIRLSVADNVAFRQCHYLGNEIFQLCDNYYHVDDFAQFADESGIRYEPATEAELEVIQGYCITDKTIVGKRVFVMAHNPKAPEPYVTWKGHKDYAGYEIGRYFKDELAAFRNYQERINEYREEQTSHFAPRASTSRGKNKETR